MDKRDILDFAINNDKLEMLNARINKFNPLKVLRVQDYEIRHSNIIAWLLGPAENHNFDDRILKHFLLKVLLNPDNDSKLKNIELVYDLKWKSLLDTRVYREKANIDLLIVSEQQKKVFIIENKIYSDEGNNQLNRYYNYLEKAYPDHDKIPIFLTLEGKLPSDNRYFIASYKDLLDTINFVIENYEDRTSSEVIYFIKYYSSILKEKYAMDEELKTLCQEIYQQYSEVIDILYEVGNEKKDINIQPAVDFFKTKFSDIIDIRRSKGKEYSFALQSFEKGRINDRNGWGGGFPICFWFSEYYGKLKIVFEVGPFDDPTKRIKFLKKLEEVGIKIGDRAKDPLRQYTRIYTETHEIKDWTDSEEIAEAMETMFKRDDLIAKRKMVEQAIELIEW